MRHSSNTPRPNRFLRAENGNLSLEAVLVIPFLIFVFVGLFSTVDAFRTIHANTLSANSIGDALSRETDYVSAAYIEGMNDVHQLLTRSGEETDMRVTVVHYDEASDELIMEWSYATGSRAALAQGDMAEISQSVPPLDDAEAVVIVETWVPFTPMSAGMVFPMEFKEIVVTRPRYAPTVAWDDASA